MIDRKYPERTVYHRRSPKNAVYNTWGSWIYQREIGCPSLLGFKDRQQKDVYSAIRPVYSWDQSNSSHPNHGGVFNFEFSPDGRILIGACERKSIIIFDALNGRLIEHIADAHSDCVNCVRFLDSRVFATCSDDMTVALWDVRYLKHRIRSLLGHSNWVKNIEYASNSRLLVTSGFDGSVYTWDINRYTEDVQFRRVFHTDGLMRTKLTPDESKLIICTTGGYLMIVNNLDLSSMAVDLQAFNPNMYRLMQLSNIPVPNGCNSNHVFTAKNNRVELISDFPSGNDAEVISSLQIHPQGWCALSRNTSSDNNSEWTCVHDIQDARFDSETSNSTGDGAFPSSSTNTILRTGSASAEPSVPENSEQPFPRPVFHIRLNCHSQEHRTDNDNEEPVAGNSGRGTIAVQLATPDILQMLQSTHENLELSPSAVASLLSSNSSPSDQTQLLRERVQFLTEGNHRQSDNRLEIENDAEETEDEEDDNHEPVNDLDRLRQGGLHLDFDDHPALFIRAVSQLASRTMVLLRPSKCTSGAADSNCESKEHAHLRKKIHQNVSRLTHYIDELNVRRGFIKELCFSTDGRLVCSPFGNGIRLLAFDSDCRELCDVPTSYPHKLVEVACNIGHKNVVVSTKFSPTHSLLVSGCLNGEICFQQPLLQ